MILRKGFDGFFGRQPSCFAVDPCSWRGCFVWTAIGRQVVEFHDGLPQGHTHKLGMCPIWSIEGRDLVLPAAPGRTQEKMRRSRGKVRAA